MKTKLILFALFLLLTNYGFAIEYYSQPAKSASNIHNLAIAKAYTPVDSSKVLDEAYNLAKTNINRYFAAVTISPALLLGYSLAAASSATGVMLDLMVILLITALIYLFFFYKTLFRSLDILYSLDKYRLKGQELPVIAVLFSYLSLFVIFGLIFTLFLKA